MRFFKCSVCGNEFEMTKDGGGTPSCCQKTMTELLPASTDGALEKHVPVCEEQLAICPSNDYKDVRIQVGSSMHPMEEHHYIQWIVVETNQGVYRRNLLPDDEPVAVFCMHPDEVVRNVYAFCNLHGLWSA